MLPMQRIEPEVETMKMKKKSSKQKRKHRKEKQARKKKRTLTKLEHARGLWLLGVIVAFHALPSSD
jgi:short subunit fatty acids transporter